MSLGREFYARIVDGNMNYKIDWYLLVLFE